MNKSTIITIAILLLTITASPEAMAAADLTKVNNFGQQVADAMRNLASIVAVIFLILSGFYYMTSSANPERLDKAKKTLIYAAIGLAIVFAASVIMEIVKSTSQGAFGG